MSADLANFLQKTLDSLLISWYYYIREREAIEMAGTQTARRHRGVTCRWNNGTLSITAPKAFMDTLDHEKILRKAEMFAPFAPTPERAIETAVEQEYAAWIGHQTLVQR